MRLVSLKIHPKGPKGLESDYLQFGGDITQILGPNGCGKTPLVQSIVYCLGYPSVFREDIYDKCSHAITEVEIDDKLYTFQRVFNSREVDIQVVEPGEVLQRFFNEKDISEYVFSLLGLRFSNLITNSNKVGYPYLATILPIFYLDQDEGYDRYYCPPGNFIKDQFSEMMRMIFNLPVKNSFDAKKDKFIAKEELDNLDKNVERKARKIELLQKDVHTDLSSSEEIEDELIMLESYIEQLKNSSSDHNDSVKIIDRLIASQNNSSNDILITIRDLKQRINSTTQIVHEINTEIETLNLNEEARRLFRSFKEICDSPNCHLFSYSSNEYSKNLLYLKDQIKDLQRNSQKDTAKVEALEKQQISIQDNIQSLVDERNEALGKSEMAAIIDTISETKNRIFDLQNSRDNLKELETLKKNYVDEIIKRDKALGYYESFSSIPSMNLDMMPIRSDLRQCFIEWLDTLNTSNISRDVFYQNDFMPILGKEKIRQLKGSTRIRAVLAFHAAIMEVIAKYAPSYFCFFILDTPKQHEIHEDDLDSFMKKLKKLAIKTNIQIVFSTTEYHYNGDEYDREWSPTYPGEKHMMYLNLKRQQ